MSLFQYPDFMQLLGAMLISLISGTVSITKRLSQGQTFTFVWFFSEFLTAMLCGYLAYISYPVLPDDVQALLTQHAFIAVCAHSGGRIFQQLEETLLSRWSSLFQRNCP